MLLKVTPYALRRSDVNLPLTLRLSEILAVAVILPEVLPIVFASSGKVLMTDGTSRPTIDITTP